MCREAAHRVPFGAPRTRGHSSCAFVFQSIWGGLPTRMRPGVPLATRAAAARLLGADTAGSLRRAGRTLAEWARRPAQGVAPALARPRPWPRWLRGTALSAPRRTSANGGPVAEAEPDPVGEPGGLPDGLVALELLPHAVPRLSREADGRACSPSSTMGLTNRLLRGPWGSRFRGGSMPDVLEGVGPAPGTRVVVNS
jgi:hypothetical protein